MKKETVMMQRDGSMCVRVVNWLKTKKVDSTFVFSLGHTAQPNDLRILYVNTAYLIRKTVYCFKRDILILLITNSSD